VNETRPRKPAFPPEKTNWSESAARKLEGSKARTHLAEFFSPAKRLLKILFGAHPYALVSPTEAQVAGPTNAMDLQTVYREIYTPENALLMLVGDFSIRKPCLKTIENTFGQWVRQKRPAVKEFPAPPKPARPPRLSRPQSRLRSRRKSSPAAMPSPASHPDWIRLGPHQQPSTAAPFNSRLVMNISRKTRATPTARAAASIRNAQHGYFSVSAAVRNDVVGASLTEIFYELDKLRSLPVPDCRTRRRAKITSPAFFFPWALAHAGGPAFAILHCRVYKRTPRRTISKPIAAKIRAITPRGPDGHRARKYFDSAQHANRKS